MGYSHHEIIIVCLLAFLEWEGGGGWGGCVLRNIHTAGNGLLTINIVKRWR